MEIKSVKFTLKKINLVVKEIRKDEWVLMSKLEVKLFNYMSSWFNPNFILKLSYLIIWVLDLIPTFSPPLASTKIQSAYRYIKSYIHS